MQRNGKRVVVWSWVVLALLIIGLTFSPKRVLASIACDKYAKAKKFNTDENKEIYFKIKWIQDNSNSFFVEHYKLPCVNYESMHNEWTGLLQKTCSNYYIHEEFEDYREYKAACHNPKKHNKNVVPTPPPVPPQQDPTPPDQGPTLD